MKCLYRLLIQPTNRIESLVSSQSSNTRLLLVETSGLLVNMACLLLRPTTLSFDWLFQQCKRWKLIEYQTFCLLDMSFWERKLVWQSWHHIEYSMSTMFIIQYTVAQLITNRGNRGAASYTIGTKHTRCLKS